MVDIVRWKHFEGAKPLFLFILERYKLALKKQQGLPKPWTQDEILQTYRFCNVYREWDRVTIWLADNWRKPNAKNPDLWFAMFVARLINWPDTLAALGFPVPWNPAKFVKTIERLQAQGGKVYTGAYMVRGGKRGDSKALYLAHEVLTPLWKARADMRPLPDVCLDNWHEAMCEFHGIGSFLAAQVIADMKYVPALRKVPDWDTFVAPGPGSRRGLNRVMGRPIRTPYSRTGLNGPMFDLTLWYLKEVIDPMVVKAGMPALHAQDLQNCLCEFDKYERVRLGEGRPRTTYQGRS